MLVRVFICMIVMLHTITSLCISNSVTFYDVGQGDCTIVKYSDHKILMIDAGTSDTTGVHNLDQTKTLETSLSYNIYSFIQADLEERQWILFIITHADKDHLNLIPGILNNIENNNKLTQLTIGFLLGGQPNTYKTTEAQKLMNMIDQNQYNYLFGENKNFTFDAHYNQYVYNQQKKTDFFPQMLQEISLGIEFFSLKADKQYKKNSSVGSNDESIVIKITLENNKTLMITGDKTSREIKNIIRRFEEDSQTNFLKADILLATHHGSEEDYCKEWLDYVNPSHIVVSAGYSIHMHPRAEIMKWICNATNKKIYQNISDWHCVHFYNDTNDFFEGTIGFHHLLQSKPLSTSKSFGYSYAVTNFSIFTTGVYGNITLNFNPFIADTVIIYGEKVSPQYTFSLNECVVNLLAQQYFKTQQRIAFPPHSIFYNTIYNYNPIYNFSPLSIRSVYQLNLKNCVLSDNDIHNLCEYITHSTEIYLLNLSNCLLSDTQKTKIRTAWGYRGLTI